ncbi:MAG: hypothetical protein LBS68_02175 [Puniceicoccales bacterium]|jgi:hypothetical protein|nr:hypothetical protein [Puniceicoccales bacterium]
MTEIFIYKSGNNFTYHFGKSDAQIPSDQCELCGIYESDNKNLSLRDGFFSDRKATNRLIYGLPWRDDGPFKVAIKEGDLTNKGTREEKGPYTFDAKNYLGGPWRVLTNVADGFLKVCMSLALGEALRAIISNYLAGTFIASSVLPVVFIWLAVGVTFLIISIIITEVYQSKLSYRAELQYA